MDARSDAPKIGRMIKRARERKRMSQAEAAEALGVSRSALNAWENDRAYPRSSIGAIEELYGIVIDGGPEPGPQRVALPPTLLREIMNTEGLTLEQRQALIRDIEEMLATERGGTASAGGAGRSAESPEAGREPRRRQAS